MSVFSNYYHRDIADFINLNVDPKQSLLEISNSKTINTSSSKSHDSKTEFDNYNESKKYDFIVISDYLAETVDVQKLFGKVRSVSDPNTRIIITYHSFLWQPLLLLAEFLGLKRKQKRNNWLNTADIRNLLHLESLEVVRSGKRFLFPIYIPLLSKFLNKYVGNLPLFNKLCLTNFIIARPIGFEVKPKSVSVVIAARNEEDNIENAIKRIPKLGSHTEIIFVEGGSSDNTWDMIVKMQKKYKDKDIKIMKQDGKGKGDAVRKGFANASGDILMILDADLTVEPEELPKFYNALIQEKGEYINGSRLVYPMEEKAMRTLNIIGNKFFSIAFSWLLNQTIKDTLCGTKVLTRENYLKLAKNRSYFGEFDPFGDYDLIFGSIKLNLKLIEVPIRYKARVYGETNISRFKHGMLLLRMVIFALNKMKFI